MRAFDGVSDVVESSLGPTQHRVHHLVTRANSDGGVSSMIIRILFMAGHL